MPRPSGLGCWSSASPPPMLGKRYGRLTHVSVPNVAGLNSQAADFQMRWQEMTVRLSVRVYGVSPATVTDAVRTGRKLPQGWLAAPLSPSPRAANNFAARCLDQICDAFAFNNALNNAVLAIFVEVPNPVPTQTILDFGGAFFSMIANNARSRGFTQALITRGPDANATPLPTLTPGGMDLLETEMQMVAAFAGVPIDLLRSIYEETQVKPNDVAAILSLPPNMPEIQRQNFFDQCSDLKPDKASVCAAL